jgi:hypothetical protein
MMSEFDRRKYLEQCSSSKMISGRDLAFCGVILVLVLTSLDLLLTMAKISAGPFMDANPLAQIFIAHGVEWGLVLFKVAAAGFFGWICLRNLHLPITQFGVGLVALAHLMLTFHWTLLV